MKVRNALRRKKGKEDAQALCVCGHPKPMHEKVRGIHAHFLHLGTCKETLCECEAFTLEGGET